jgi:hypothetical protein
MDNWEKVEYSKVKSKNDSINNKMKIYSQKSTNSKINKNSNLLVDKKIDHNRIQLKNDNIPSSNIVSYDNSLQSLDVGSISIIKRPQPNSINNDNMNQTKLNNKQDINININKSINLKNNNMSWADNMINKSINQSNKHIKKIDPIVNVNKKKPSIVSYFKINFVFFFSINLNYILYFVGFLI